MSKVILDDIKDTLDLGIDDNTFDTTLALFVNATISKLRLLGVDPPAGFHVTAGGEETWADYLGDKEFEWGVVKMYISMKCRLNFDPPGNSFLVKAIETQVEECAVDITMLTED